jgi:KDO2-lipid IV(A) lauroyltransferase
MSVLDRLEAALVGALLRIFGALPPSAASNLAGGFAARVGPLLPVSRVAHDNLAAAMPELDARARARIVRGVWENLGRTAGEFPHVAGLPHNAARGPGWELEGEDIVTRLAASGGPAIFFSGHIGNWEVLRPAAFHYGIAIGSLYRAAQNARVDALITSVRGRGVGEAPKLFPKGAKGARQVLAHLRAGGFLALLVDQKLNDGIEARFFGRPAMTAPAAASFALHFRCPLVPAHCVRVGPARLRLIVEPPLPLPDTGDRARDVAVLTQMMNDVLERWVREQPESWLWLHRRWKK